MLEGKYCVYVMENFPGKKKFDGQQSEMFRSNKFFADDRLRYSQHGSK